ncbi:hypothetical protein J4Q44_G00283400 [Coregonus suidteri]|uniref:Uncharacterized protein n=1 Tax=Coregonus suidteri TaxID=861788 RepID=A0AAN8KWP3_9TELE
MHHGCDDALEHGQISTDWGLEDEELDDDITDNPEPMEDDEQQRLYTHWQAIASTHQVSIPREMTGPIQELDAAEPSPRERAGPLCLQSLSMKSWARCCLRRGVVPAGKWA